MSSKNPFRKPSPSEVKVTPPSPPLPPLPPHTPSPPLPAASKHTPSPTPPALPPRSPTSGPSSQSPVPTPSSHGSPPNPSSTLTIADIINDDLPPAYTPAANADEATVGLGPMRPFQQPPPIPPPSLYPQPDSRYHSNWPPPPAQPLQPFPTGLGSSSSYRMQPGLAPWQTPQQYRQRQNPGGGLLGALFDSVRDIADVVSGAHDDRMMATRRANTGAYATPYYNSSSVYAPPPGPPVQSLSPPPRLASTSPRSPPPTVPDDGSPTRTPVPGHPLLRGGHLLVYPRDHLCVKCKNTGYKDYDPSNPCRKCWEKYGKLYTGPLTYAPWSPSGNDSRMQRPLPKFTPPHLAGLNHGRHPPPPQHPQHSGSVSDPHYVHSPGPGPSYYVMDPLSGQDPIPPVPHAIMVLPGDPRMGGELCLRCGGEGVRTVMFIDVTTCEDCGGTGRIWT